MLKQNFPSQTCREWFIKLCAWGPDFAARNEYPAIDSIGEVKSRKNWQNWKEKRFFKDSPRELRSSRPAGNCSGYLSPADIMCIQLQLTIGLLEQKMCLIITTD